ANRFGRSGVGKGKRCGRHRQVIRWCRLPPMIASSAPSAAPIPGDRDWRALASDIQRWGEELGLQRIGIADTNLDPAEQRLLEWLRMGRHGAMDYMARHGVARARPAELVPGTLRVITARIDYRPPGARASAAVLADPTKAFIARYALGRDYHKVLRAKLKRLALRIRDSVGEFGYRVFTDSAPVLEVALAARSGL